MRQDTAHYPACTDESAVDLQKRYGSTAFRGHRQRPPTVGPVNMTVLGDTPLTCTNTVQVSSDASLNQWT